MRKKGVDASPAIRRYLSIDRADRAFKLDDASIFDLTLVCLSLPQTISGW
jgi:hypothetical protein